MSQLLIVDDKAMDVERMFKENGASAAICEFSNGNWGYTGGDLISKPEEVSFLPKIHQDRALSWLSQRKTSTKRERASDSALMAMKQDELIALAGWEPTGGEAKPSKAELIELIKKSAE